MIDFAGPWEVFQDVEPPPGRGTGEAFDLYTVAETLKPLRSSGGMTIVPEFTFQTAPTPHVIVVPAQSGPSVGTLEWLRTSAATADVVMSVCTGAFVLGEAGLLDGKAATTHHSFFSRFSTSFPGVELRRGRRFVEYEKVATAGGLTSGIDLALRVVERYFGRAVADRTADYMEYQGEGWRDATGGANAKYAGGDGAGANPSCPVCGMDVEAGRVTYVHGGQRFHFCSDRCKAQFVRGIPSTSREVPPNGAAFTAPVANASTASEGSR
jgi:putative intracellular protease/amidase/YHS domain-containing protein